MRKNNKELWKGMIYNGENFGPYWEVSNFGKIRNTKTKRLLRPYKHRGYLIIASTIYISSSQKEHYHFRVHRAVACTFIPNPENKQEVNHIDGNKENNCVANLEWCTPWENKSLAHQMGLMEAPPIQSKLSIEAIRDIRENCISKKHCQFGPRHFAKKYNVSEACVRNILRGHSWKNIT